MIPDAVTISEEEMFNKMIKVARERSEKWNQIIVDQFPRLSELTEDVYIGSFSWFGKTTKTRWIYAPTMVNVGGYIATPGDIARDYVTIKYTQRRRVTTSQYHKIMAHRHHPLHAEVGWNNSAVYIDLKSAYWQIIKIVGWDTDYNPGYWLGVGSEMTDFPFSGNKLARNCLVTIGLNGMSKIWRWKEKKIETEKSGNENPNNVLWALVQDVLNGVASDCIKAGAKYVHTDGYICAKEDELSVRSSIARWGLVSSVKSEGLAHIYGTGSYDIGSHIAQQRGSFSKGGSSVYEPDRIDWLRDKINHWSQRRT